MLFKAYLTEVTKSTESVPPIMKTPKQEMQLYQGHKAKMIEN